MDTASAVVHAIRERKKGKNMRDKEYYLFERMTNGSLRWVGSAMGLTETHRRLDQLARASGAECLAYDQETRQVIAYRRASGGENLISLVAFPVKESNRKHVNKKRVAASFNKNLGAARVAGTSVRKT